MMTAKRFTIQGVGISDHERKRLYDLKTVDGFISIRDLLNELQKENEQLKQRNDRQAKRLAKLYELMAKKDWESLTEIIDDFCSCEEQLQREWRTYE